MTDEAELAFADQVGRFFARQYGLPTMTGRVAGWLLICDPPEQTIAELAESLRASRTAIGSAVSSLETWALVRRSRAAGERADRVAIHAALGMQALEVPAEYVALGAIARQGLDTLRDAPPAQRARLQEVAAMSDFLVERLPALVSEWYARRDELVAAGDLPASSAPRPGGQS